MHTPENSKTDRSQVSNMGLFKDNRIYKLSRGFSNGFHVGGYFPHRDMVVDFRFFEGGKVCIDITTSDNPNYSSLAMQFNREVVTHLFSIPELRPILAVILRNPLNNRIRFQTKTREETMKPDNLVVFEYIRDISNKFACNLDYINGTH